MCRPRSFATIHPPYIISVMNTRFGFDSFSFSLSPIGQVWHSPMNNKWLFFSNVFNGNSNVRYYVWKNITFSLSYSDSFLLLFISHEPWAKNELLWMFRISDNVLFCNPYRYYRRLTLYGPLIFQFIWFFNMNCSHWAYCIRTDNIIDRFVCILSFHHDQIPVFGFYTIIIIASASGVAMKFFCFPETLKSMTFFF